MKELEIIDEALNVSAKHGVFNLREASKLDQCIGIVRARLSASEAAPKAVEGKPAKVLTK